MPSSCRASPSFTPAANIRGGEAPLSRGLADVADVDTELLREAAKGNAVALGTLYDKYVNVLFSVAYRILGNRSDAEDLVHDVFVEAWQKADTHEPERANVRSWLLLRTRSRAIDRLRRDQHRIRESEVGPEPVTPADQPERLAEQERARLALETLPKEHRSVVERSYFQGLSCSAIAELDALPMGTVKSRLAAGVSKLRDALRVRRGEFE